MVVLLGERDILSYLDDKRVRENKYVRLCLRTFFLGSYSYMRQTMLTCDDSPLTWRDTYDIDRLSRCIQSRRAFNIYNIHSTYVMTITVLMYTILRARYPDVRWNIYISKRGISIRGGDYTYSNPELMRYATEEEVLLCDISDFGEYLNDSLIYRKIPMTNIVVIKKYLIDSVDGKYRHDIMSLMEPGVDIHTLNKNIQGNGRLKIQRRAIIYRTMVVVDKMLTDIPSSLCIERRRGPPPVPRDHRRVDYDVSFIFQ